MDTKPLPRKPDHSLVCLFPLEAEERRPGAGGGRV